MKEALKEMVLGKKGDPPIGCGCSTPEARVRADRLRRAELVCVDLTSDAVVESFRAFRMAKQQRLHDEEAFELA